MLPFNVQEEIPVMEHFYTIQGEGTFSGQAAYFIRLAGCDVGCHWCDVKESWDVKPEQVISIKKIVAAASENKARIAVITGGEPLMYDLKYLSNALKEAGFRVHIETSGAYPLTGTIDWVCLSPKKFKAPLPQIIPLAQELKIIIFNKSDFDWAEQFAAKSSQGCRLFLQAEWGKMNQMMPAIVNYIKKDPKWQLSVQIHKFYNIP